MEKNKLLAKKIKQFFCIHNYKIVKEHDDLEERNSIVEKLREGEMVVFLRLHRCTKCGKEKVIGNGIVL